MATAVRIHTVAYPSFYVTDLPAARAFYERVLGPVGHEEDGLCGFRLGDTWLTLFDAGKGPSPGAGPLGAEIALRVGAPSDVDALHALLIERGARNVMAPRDTWMYERLRFACVDDPFGLRLDVYCPIP